MTIETGTAAVDGGNGYAPEFEFGIRRAGIGQNVHPLEKATGFGGLILLEDGHCLRDHALAACGLNPPARLGEEEGFAATSLPTLMQMVGSGLGVSLVPAMAVESGLAERAHVSVRRLDAEHPSREIVVIWRDRSSRAAEGRLLAEALR